MIKNYQDLKNFSFDNQIGIPKIVFRTGNLKIVDLPYEIKELYNHEIFENPEYSFFYFDEDERLEYIQDLKDEIVLNVYNSLIPKAFQVDFWRYLIINQYGGIYFDYTIQSLKKYGEILKNYEAVFVKDYLYPGLLNGFFASKKNNFLLKNMINSVIENVTKKYYGKDSLDVTGPNLFGREFKKLYNINDIEAGINKNNIFIYESKSFDDNCIIDPLSKEEIIKIRLPNHYNLLYKNISGKWFFSPYYYNYWTLKMIYRDDRFNTIEQLYKETFKDIKDITEIHYYYNSDLELDQIEKNIKLLYMNYDRKKIQTYEDLKEYKLSDDGKIPKIIFRTSNWNVDYLPPNILELYHDEFLLNPDYTLFYFDDEDCQMSIEDSKDERLIYAYNHLIPTAFKADLWRYYMLYKYGGIYVDFSHKVLIDYDKIINEKSEVFIKDKQENAIYNAFMCSAKNNKIFDEAIKMIYKNVEENLFYDSTLETTGPILLNNAYNQINLKDFDYEYFHIYDETYNFYNPLSYVIDSDGQTIINCKQKNHNLMVYSNDESSKYYSLHKRNKIYKDNRWIEIENLYKTLLLRKPDFEGIISYQDSPISIAEIKNNILQSEEYNNLKINKKINRSLVLTYKDLKEYKFNNDGEIPKIIFRTSRYKIDELPLEIIDIYENEMIKNKNYTLFYFDDEDCQMSIEDSKDERLIYAYNHLIPTAFKADLWRYYILHKYGGVYTDFSHKALIKYDNILKNEKELFLKDKINENGINNSFIACCSDNKVIKEAIEICIENVLSNKIEGMRMYEFTGPQVLEKAFRKIYNIQDDIQFLQVGTHSIKIYLHDKNLQNIDRELVIIDEDGKEIVLYRSLQMRHYELLYDHFNTKNYPKFYEDGLIYKNSRWLRIEYLFKSILLRSASIDQIHNYYISNLYLDQIRDEFLNSEEYNNLPKKEQKSCLFDYEKKVFSQNKEDGIIEYLLQKIGFKNKYYVEFGVENGHECNTRYIREYHGFSGLMMDGSNENHEIGLYKEFITPSNINSLFEKYKVPEEFDLLSIDIDFNDFYIWKSIDEKYKPNIVVIEYNAEHAPPKSLVVQYEDDRMWDYTKYYGASLVAINHIAKQKGYTLIYCDSEGVNSFFVRNDLIDKLEINIPTLHEIFVPYDRHKESEEKMIEYIP